MRVSVLASAGSVVLGVALAAWVLWSRPGSGVPEGDRHAGNGIGSHLQAPPTLAGAPPGTALRERAAVPTSPQWMLRGKIEGLEADQVASARVTTSSLAAIPRSDGTFEIDVTPLLSVNPQPEGIVVIAEHPDYLRASAQVPAHAQADAHPVILECVLRMQRAKTVRVQVMDDVGNPLAAAAVGAFPKRDEVPHGWPCDEAMTDATGATGLRIPAEGETLLVAASAGRLPESLSVRGEAPGTPTLRLAEGGAIEGAVREDDRPVAGATLLAQTDSSGQQQLHLGGDEIHWDSGSVAPGEVTATTNADGRYRIEGLPGWAYRVRVERLADGRKPLGFVRTEHPPARGIDFDLTLGHVVLTITCEGSPVAGATIWIFAGGFAHSIETDVRGEAHAVLAAAEHYSAQVDRDGYKQTRAEFQSPEHGARSAINVRMERIPPHGSLKVDLRDPHGKLITTAGLAFFPAEAEKDVRPEVRFADGQAGFSVSDIEAGRYRLVVRPGRHWDPDFTWDSEAVSWLDETMTVDVPRQGEAEISLVARPGGRLRIDARSPGGQLITPTCALLDASGEAIAFDLATRLGVNGAYTLGGKTLMPNGPGDVVAALAPGHYRLNLTLEGYADKSVEIAVEGGATRTVRVTLEPLQDVGPDRPAPVPAMGNR